ncbi:hypothetical protein PAXINDRAFT_17024 [Paxillus involutus ATCC 200175]|uniref:Uncharacterized protein n=1 Tax=Paxillus involutus ATCC 200175 TaxID=664439 RepID=A0A0C9SQU2_PAXIN|nr:hypothetical protein PAXINDRAFT_17024 [Paxillus involutus ATCC 200175]
MLRRPEHLQVTDEVWNAWLDHVKASIYAGLGSSQPNPASMILDPALTGSGPRRPHDTYRDGPTSPHPYGSSTTGAVSRSRHRTLEDNTGKKDVVGGGAGIVTILLSTQIVLVEVQITIMSVERVQVVAATVPLHPPLEKDHDQPPTLEKTSVDNGLYDEDAEDILKPSRELSDAGKEVRKELKQLLMVKFRYVCNVPEGKPWPSPDEECTNEKTGKRYLLPKFNTNVNDGHNRTIFDKVAGLVWTDLQTLGMPACLENRKAKWDKNVLFLFAKDTYRNLKDDWRAQTIPEKGVAKRRKEKAQRLLLARDTFMDKHGVDPAPLVYAEHMSDEGSGPEDDTDTARKVWTKAMAEKVGMADTTDLEGVTFLEVMKCPWRTEELGDICHELYGMWRASLTAKQKKRFQTIHVHGTDRESPWIPLDTPFNFGIDMDWFDVAKESCEHGHLLTDWGQWEDPEGFGSRKHAGPSGTTENGNEQDIEQRMNGEDS